MTPLGWDIDAIEVNPFLNPEPITAEWALTMKIKFLVHTRTHVHTILSDHHRD